MRKSCVVFVIALTAILAVGCGCKHEYDNGKVTTPSTCTEEGEKTLTCKLCGDTKTEKIPIADHKWDKGDIITEATCTQEGEQYVTCSVCGETSTEAIPTTEHDYEEKVTKEATFESEGEKTYTCKICGDTKTEVIPIRDEEVVVTVTSKKNLPKDYDAGRYSERCQFVFNVENMTDKDIKGVQGTLKICDLFGEEIISFGCDFTGQNVPAKKSVDYTEMGIDINEFMDSHVKLYNTDLDDLTFEYTINNIVYSDGASKASTADTQTSISSQEVEVIVTNKKSLPKNYSAGRYSARVEFEFTVKNNTDKDIKGVQGVLSINDLFGSTIEKIGCDFTGKTIPANGSADFGDLGIDINEFMDDDVKVYNEDFSDLQFSYEVTDVVYK